MREGAPIAVELFSGCGGMSTGLLDAGIRVVAGFDNDARAIEAYNYNHEYRGSRGFVMDVAGMSGKDVLELAGVSRIDLLVGGPPCQPFSIAGRRLGRHDQRSSMISEFVRIAAELKPKAIFFENVPNLFNIEDGRIYRRLRRSLQELGYGIASGIFAAAEFGVPQLRRRLLLVGISARCAVDLPEPTHALQPQLIGAAQAYVPVREVLKDLPDAADFGACGVFNHEPTVHTPNMLERFAQLAVGTRDKGSFHDRLHPERPSYTLRAGSGNFSPLRPVHYQYDRVITVRESARIQGFRDDFIWPDSIPRLQQYRQVGNAVPPPVARAVAISLARQLRWPLRPAELLGDPSSRSSAITLTDDQRRTQRLKLIRGASLGNGTRPAQKGA